MDKPNLPTGNKSFQLGQAPEEMSCEQAQEIMARAKDENEKIGPDLLARAVDHMMHCSACGTAISEN